MRPTRDILRPPLRPLRQLPGIAITLALALACAQLACGEDGGGDGSTGTTTDDDGPSSGPVNTCPEGEKPCPTGECIPDNICCSPMGLEMCEGRCDWQFTDEHCLFCGDACAMGFSCQGGEGCVMDPPPPETSSTDTGTGSDSGSDTMGTIGDTGSGSSSSSGGSGSSDSGSGSGSGSGSSSTGGAAT